MMSNQKHIIQRALIELISASRHEASQWQARASQLVKEIIQPGIEDSFSRVAPVDQHFVLDRVEIDLGVIPADQVEQELQRQLNEELNRQLNGVPGVNGDLHGGVEEKEGAWAIEEPDSVGKARRMKETECRIEAVFYFLQTGRLPFWWDSSEKLGNDWVADLNDEMLGRLKSILTEFQEARLRFVFQFEDNTLDQILTSLGSQDDLKAGWMWFQRFFSAWSRTEDDATTVQSLRKVYWLGWITHCIGIDHQAPLITTMARRLWGQDTGAIQRFVFAVKNESEASKVELLMPDLEMPPMIRRMISEGGKVDLDVTQRRLKEEPSDAVEAQEEHLPKNNRTPEYNGGTDPGSEFEALVLSGDSDKDIEAVNGAEAFFVKNAGLILLHPFLSELFQSCGLWQGGAFTSSDGHSRAVRLLGYLSSGENQLEEYNCVLTKFLCHFPSQSALDTKEPLLQTEKDACDALLTAVIKHWAALRSTSPEGLRTAFFHRDGKLYPKGNGWHLTVERKAQDVLLASIPWGYTTFKLPWMPKILHVSWA